MITGFILGFFTAYAVLLLGCLAMLADMGMDPEKDIKPWKPEP